MKKPAFEAGFFVFERDTDA